MVSPKLLPTPLHSACCQNEHSVPMSTTHTLAFHLVIKPKIHGNINCSYFYLVRNTEILSSFLCLYNCSSQITQCSHGAKVLSVKKQKCGYNKRKCVMFTDRSSFTKVWAGGSLPCLARKSPVLQPLTCRQDHSKSAMSLELHWRVILPLKNISRKDRLQEQI